EIFPLIMETKIWLGAGFANGNAFFSIPSGVEREFADGVYDPSTGLVKFRNVGWFTNMDHKQRHEELKLMTMADNLKYSRHKEIKGKAGYERYDNYDAIEVPFTDAIPSDYEGVMGVPITFLDKYNPEQFEILGATQRGCHDLVPDTRKYDEYWEVRQDGSRTGSSGGKTNENANLAGNDGRKNYFINAEGRVIQSAYQRIFIRHRNPAPKTP
ncbi:MAG: adenine-specific methyltransferase EcoRI family protein, partial [Fimbriimonadaceae bacterium]|nr:adenine-specific methyltransferase EcoRI family protein [Fimbriimonadaceae bacterium]